MSALKSILGVLEFGSFSTTYKLALLRSVVDYAFARPEHRASFGFHFVPMLWIARRFLEYYWIALERDIWQSPKGSLAVWTHLNSYAQSDGALLQRGNVASLRAVRDVLDTDEQLPGRLQDLLYAIRDTIIHYPVQHVQNLRNEEVNLFTLFVRDPQQSVDAPITIAEEPEKGFPAARMTPKQADGLIRLRQFSPSWDNLLVNEFAYLGIPDSTYRELAALRTMLRDSISMRWVRLCASYADRAGRVHEHLDLSDAMFGFEIERDSGAMHDYHRLYADLSIEQCVYTGELCAPGFPLDHMLPFRYFPDNSFWNLYPIRDGSLNSSKSDLLPDLSGAIQARIHEHVRLCLQSGHPRVRQDLNRLERGMGGTPSTSDAVPMVTEHLLDMHRRLHELVPGRLWTPAA